MIHPKMQSIKKNKKNVGSSFFRHVLAGRKRDDLAKNVPVPTIFSNHSVSQQPSGSSEKREGGRGGGGISIPGVCTPLT